MDISIFLLENGAGVFAVVPVEELPDADQVDVRRMLPAARAVILFGAEVPAAAYKKPAKEKTRVMLRIAEQLDKTANLLAGHLRKEQEQALAVAVPLYLPVTISGDHVKGLVQLKRIAATGGLGTIGRNSLLLSPRYGPRLLFSGVVTSLDLPGTVQHGQTGKEPGPSETPLCTGCERCIEVCPGGAFGEGGVDAFRCRTVSRWVSPRIVPLVKWMLKRDLLLRCAAPFAPWIARMTTIRCSLCVTKCPLFAGRDEE